MEIVYHSGPTNRSHFATNLLSLSRAFSGSRVTKRTYERFALIPILRCHYAKCLSEKNTRKMPYRFAQKLWSSRHYVKNKQFKISNYSARWFIISDDFDLLCSGLSM